MSDGGMKVAAHGSASDTAVRLLPVREFLTMDIEARGVPIPLTAWMRAGKVQADENQRGRLLLVLVVSRIFCNIRTP